MTPYLCLQFLKATMDCVLNVQKECLGLHKVPEGFWVRADVEPCLHVSLLGSYLTISTRECKRFYVSLEELPFVRLAMSRKKCAACFE